MIELLFNNAMSIENSSNSSQSRLNQIEAYETQLNEYNEHFEKLLNELSLDLENVKIQQQKINSLVNCPFNPAHKVPSKSFERHFLKCELKSHGIHNELGKRKKLPSSNYFYQNASSVISLNKEELRQISEIKEGPLSLTVNQRLHEYEKEIETCNQIRELHQQQKKDVYQNFDQVWEAVQKMKEQNQGQKTREELLAEKRDYKRRRKSYRAKNIKITQRTPTQVHRDIIAAYMEDFKLLAQFETNQQEQKESPPNPSRYPY